MPTCQRTNKKRLLQEDRLMTPGGWCICVAEVKVVCRRHQGEGDGEEGKERTARVQKNVVGEGDVVRVRCEEGRGCKAEREDKDSAVWRGREMQTRREWFWWRTWPLLPCPCCLCSRCTCPDAVCAPTTSSKWPVCLPFGHSPLVPTDSPIDVALSILAISQ